MKGNKRHNRHRTPKVINKGLDYELLAKDVFLLKKNKHIILAHEDMRNCVLNVKNYVCMNDCDLNYYPSRQTLRDVIDKLNEGQCPVSPYLM